MLNLFFILFFPSVFSQTCKNPLLDIQLNIWAPYEKDLIATPQKYSPLSNCKYLEETDICCSNLTIIDYSKKGLEAQAQRVYWRVKGEQNWKEEPLKSAGNDTHFYATIPTKVTHEIIEYYISAASKSGNRETMPRTAPSGFYTVER